MKEQCPSCRRWTDIGDWPWCPHGKPTVYEYFPDEIPGGMVIENLGRHPVTVYSHSERRALMKARGLEEYIRHAPLPGSDKSAHTTRWSTVDAKTLENAAILVSRQSKAASAPELPDHVVAPDGRNIALHPGRTYRGVLDHE